jgi:hypothetical protein
MEKIHRLLLPLFALWLVGWMVLSWAAIQDDALIHLRYADNLYLHHMISYDGVHPNYGASSLLYVSILAVLRSFISSPNLPRATSSVVHLLLFAGLAALFAGYVPRVSRLAHVLGVILLALVVLPSAVRWLDDGMETGLVLCWVALLCWLIFQETLVAGASPWRYIVLATVAFFAVLLRIELFSVCAVGSALVLLRRTVDPVNPVDPGRRPSVARRFEVALECSHLVSGGLLACAVIVWKMHVLLPDTAVAKSLGRGHWFNVLHDTAITLGGAFSFGVGMLFFWLLTLLLLVRRSRRMSLANLLANVLFPTLLSLSSLRGQQIQGVRYFAWTFLFSSLWNVLQLGQLPPVPALETRRRDYLLVGVFLALLAVGLPFESIVMYRVLVQRSKAMRTFEGQHLEVLQGERGVASDIGFIGYFSKADLCDLAGLVNGRAAAHLTKLQRLDACARSNPEFLFGNTSQLGPLATKLDLSRWQICGQYAFNNVRTPDSHYLIVPPAAANRVCSATGRAPIPLTSVMKGLQN